MNDRPNNRPNGSKGRPQNRRSNQRRRNTGPAPAGLPARVAAAKLLDHVLHEKRALDEGLNDALGDLEGKDRAFARALAATTLRHWGPLTKLSRRFIDKPIKPKARTADYALKIGMAELLLLDTPPHAAVSVAVALARTDRNAAPVAGLVNAVLRRVAEAGKQALAEEDTPQLHQPNWLWNAWSDAFGDDAAAQIVSQHTTEAPLDLSVKPDVDKQALAKAVSGLVMDNGSIRIKQAGRVEELPGYEDGQWWVQDVAASLPVALAGDVAGKQVLDLCAAPGGKTCQLATGGADVTAVDISDARLERLHENLERLNLSAEIACVDALHFEADTPFDLALVDAPCSATGTIRRHPDLPWIKSPKDLASLTKLQAAMLDHAANQIKAGGMLIYCTCSLLPDEGESQISAFLSRRSDFAILPIKADEVAFLPASAVNESGLLRTLPHFWAAEGGMDGFFIARLVKQP